MGPRRKGEPRKSRKRVEKAEAPEREARLKPAVREELAHPMTTG